MKIGGEAIPTEDGTKGGTTVLGPSSAASGGKGVAESGCGFMLDGMGKKTRRSATGSVVSGGDGDDGGPEGRGVSSGVQTAACV